MENLLITTEEQIKKIVKASMIEALNNFNPSNSSSELGDYIEEKQAIQILGRKTTWFYNMRQAGKLPFTKVGSKTFYSKADLLNILDLNKK
jgi:hypothetical protein